MASASILPFDNYLAASMAGAVYLPSLFYNLLTKYLVIYLGLEPTGLFQLVSSYPCLVTYEAITSYNTA